MRIHKQLASLEWEIMQVIWKINKTVSVREVLKAAFPNGDKAYTTVQTVMNNLVDKNYLVKEKIGMVNFYTPIIKKQANTKSELEGFVKKVFAGSAFSLVNHLLGEDYLSEDEIANLKKIIDDHNKKDQ